MDRTDSPDRSRTHSLLQLRSWLVAALLLLASSWMASLAQAQTFPSACSDCHGAPPSIAASVTDNSGSTVYGIGESWMTSATALRTRVQQAGVSQGVLTMQNISTTDAESVWGYLVALRDAVVDPPAPSFPSTAAGATSTSSFTFTIANRRDHALTYSLPISGTHAGDFTVQSHSASGDAGCSAGNVPASTDALARICTVSVTLAFSPAGTGSRSGALGLNLSSGANNPQPLDRSFALSANAFAPIVVSPTNLSVGATVGSPATGNVLVTNQSSSVVTINGFSFTGTHASEFTRDASSTCSAGGSVAATSSCTLVVRFDPASATPTSRSAAVAIAHTAFGSPQSVTLQGTATSAPQGVLESSASSLSFPDTQVGAAASQSLTLRNTGTAALTFSSFTLGGAQAADFERSGDCATATPLATSAQCTLTLTFRPSALGARSASVTVAHNGSNPSAAIALAGNGIPVPLPVATFDPAAGLDFGAQTVGGLYPARTLRLTNTGSASMTVASVVVEGAVFADVSAAPCPATLAPAASCDVQVRFTAAAAAAGYSGVLRFTTNAAGSPHVLPLSGSGTLAAVAVLEWAPAVTQFDFGTISVGVISAVQSATLRNAGPGGVTLSLINTVGADSSMFSAGSDATDASACRAGRVLFEGDTCRVDVRFAPGANGARSANLQIASDGSAPPTLALSGSGSAGATAAMALSPMALTLDSARAGSVSAPSEVAIRNSGAGALTVQSMGISGPFRVDSKSCPLATPFTLAAGAACTLTVTFAPQGEGAASGALTVVSDASPDGQAIALSASAEARAEDGGGGCSISEGRSPLDPTLWSLALLAIVALYARRRRRQARPLQRHEDDAASP